jgi:hypothetical protein
MTGVEVRQLDLEIDCAGFAGTEVGQLPAFTGGIGATEVHAEVVPDHKADYGKRQILNGADGDAHGDACVGLQKVDRFAVVIVDADSEDFGLPVPVPVVDVGEGSNEFLGSGGVGQLGGGNLERCVLQVGGIALVHFGHIAEDNFVGGSELADVAVFEPKAAVTDRFHITHGMRDEDDGDTAGSQLMNFAHAALAKVDISDGERFVDQEDLGVDVDGDGEGEAYGHAARVGFDGLIDEVAYLGKLFNVMVACVNVARREAKD